MNDDAIGLLSSVFLVIGDCWQIVAETAAIMLAAAVVIYLEARISHARRILRAPADTDTDG